MCPSAGRRGTSLLAQWSPSLSQQVRGLVGLLAVSMLTHLSLICLSEQHSLKSPDVLGRAVASSYILATIGSAAYHRRSCN